MEIVKPERSKFRLIKELFKLCETEQVSYFINEDSALIPDYVQMYEFVGLMMAKAIWDKIPLNLVLNPLLIRSLLGNNE
jgi:hypothetical protein